MKKLDRLSQLEAMFQRPRTSDHQRMALQRLLLALRTALTSTGDSFIPALVALRDRMRGHSLTPADCAALASLRPSDLTAVGVTPTDVVNLVHDALTQY